MAEPTSLPPAATAVITAPTPLAAGGPRFEPNFDPIELLPPRAAAKLRLLRQRRADAHKIIPPFEEIREASMTRVAAAAAVKRLTSHPAESGFNLPPDDRRVVEAQQLLDKKTDDFRRVTELQERRSAAFQTVSAALQNVEEWLKSGRPGNTTLEAVDEIEAKLNKGESLTDGIERLRRRVRELRADHHRVASAPFPSNYCKAQMASQIEELAQRGAPSVALLIEHGRKIEFETMRVQSQIFGKPPALAFAEVTDVLALTCWLFKDKLIAALDREIDTEADDAAALSPEVRKQREAEVMADLLAAERDESSLVWRAQSENLPCEHRSDCAPQAILGLVAAVSPTNASIGSSLMHAWDVALGGRR